MGALTCSCEPGQEDWIFVRATEQYYGVWTEENGATVVAGWSFDQGELEGERFVCLGCDAEVPAGSVRWEVA